MKKFAVSGILVLVILFCSSFDSSAFTPGRVQITVQDFYDPAVPIASAGVTMDPGGYVDITDDNGTVTFTDIIPYRNYTVAVTREGYIGGMHGEGRTGFVWVESGRTTRVIIPLKKQSRIYGTVTSGTGPVTGAMVALVREGIDGLEAVITARCDDSGAYLLESVAEGSYYLRAVADGHYQEDEALVIGANDELVKDFTLRPGKTLISFDIRYNRNYYGGSVSLTPSTNLLFYNDRYLVPLRMPAGAELLDVSGTTVTPTLPGEYTFAMIVVDFKGVGKETIQTIEMINHPTEAYPSVIPGPSELPLLDNGTVYAVSRGSINVRPGETVYLRGWGRDFNLNSSEQFNPDAPLFDIYGNKNGDWHQSAFTFTWSLQDENGDDQTALLQNPFAQNTYFTIPAHAGKDDSFFATLTVSGDGELAGEPSDIAIVVADYTGDMDGCGVCHQETQATYKQTSHYTAGVGCEDCHGPGSRHSADDGKISKTHWPGMCGQCHSQFAEWQKSRHSDPLAFGHAEISFALIRECYKCHYTEGFIGAVEARRNFSSFKYPLFTQAPKDTPNISCDVCHDPHVQDSYNPTGLRTGSAAALCSTCHEKKWQNATYTASGDELGNAYHWGDYSVYRADGNPHHMKKGCAACHMAKDVADIDSRGVRTVGGHGMRMRAMGIDEDPDTQDDTMNIVVCQNCHDGLETFDYNTAMTRIKTKLKTLGDLLREKNHGYLPPFQPGKCATCHRGGSLPFINDTDDEVLGKAYLNYKLILHDRSFGIHNPGYIERLLDDSIEAVSNEQ